VTFIIKRFLYGILVLLGVLVIVFVLFNVLPGDPARMITGQHADEASLKAIYKDLGLDKPLPTQFFMYLNDLSPVSFHNEKNPESSFYLEPEKYEYSTLFTAGETVCVFKFPYLRRSYQSKRKVSEIISEAMPETFVLAISAILIATVLGIVLGIITAIKKGSFIDSFTLIFSVMGMAGPSFFIALIFAWVFGYLLSDYTGLNMYGSLYTLDDYGNGEYLDLKNLILPAITLGIRPLAIVVQLTRNSLLDVLSLDYIRTAKAKGLGFYTIIFKHALKNALNPVITAISGWFAGLMAGAVFIEYVFDWKGIGYEVVKALEKYDFPVVMGSVLVITTIFVTINVLVDIAYGILDPRVRVK
jgi:peptide/nickel transport system permease protein